MSEGYSDINNYTFEKDIGEGNFGKVKLGIFKPTGEEFAIKVLNKDKIKIKMKNSIFKENQIITKFNHINVIYVFQILEDKENFYIIMEYCKHGELFDYIVKNERLSEEEASVFFYQLINGIEHIHSKGIAHRDLKPENLLLAENNVLKIIDFGLSHEFLGEEDELLKTKCGSPSYAAPEIICCPFYDGFKVDVWCIGIILYAMICGYLPFEGDNNDILFKNILDCDPEFPEFLSDISIDIIQRILNTDPDKRITIEEIKKHKFYLMGKSLCNIDYDTIENSIIKRRNSIFKNKDEEKNCLNSNNKSNDISNSDIKPKYYNTINNNIEKPILDLNKKDEKNSDSNSKKENKNNINKTNNSLELFKKKFMDINNKFNKKTIDTVTNKIKQKLKTEANENNKNSSRPISSKKNGVNTNKQVMITSNNINDNNKIINPFNILNFETFNNKFKKDSLFIKILDSTKNKNFLSFYKDYEKLGLIKYNTNKTNLDKVDTKGKNKKSIKSKNKNKENIDNNNIKKVATTNNNLISLSNDNLNNNNRNNHIKKSQKYNLFKETLKNKNKGKPRFNIMKALSHYDKNENKKTAKSPTTPNLTKKNSSHINTNSNISTRINKNKEINFIVPHSTLYYNNINININELNINPKTSKNKNSPFISTLLENQKKKNIGRTYKNEANNIKYNFNSLDIKTHKQNKAISAKRLFSYNIKNNKKNKSNNNTINTQENIYTINLNNNRHFSINALNNINIKENNINSNKKRNSKNKKLLFKPERILSTEPKEMFKFKKQFSFDKRDINNRGKNKNNKNVKKDKRSKSERANKSRTINTEISKINFYNKKFIKKDSENSKYKCDLNKIDELFLNMFMIQKYKKKNIKENNFHKKVIYEK